MSGERCGDGIDISGVNRASGAWITGSSIRRSKASSSTWGTVGVAGSYEVASKSLQCWGNWRTRPERLTGDADMDSGWNADGSSGAFAWSSVVSSSYAGSLETPLCIYVSIRSCSLLIPVEPFEVALWEGLLYYPNQYLRSHAWGGSLSLWPFAPEGGTSSDGQRWLYLRCLDSCSCSPSHTRMYHVNSSLFCMTSSDSSRFFQNTYLGHSTKVAVGTYCDDGEGYTVQD